MDKSDALFLKYNLVEYVSPSEANKGLTEFASKGWCVEQMQVSAQSNSTLYVFLFSKWEAQ